MNLWLIGSGLMALDYAKIIKALNIEFAVIGRGIKSAQNFEKIISTKVIRGGVSHALSTYDPPEVAIVAVGVEQLAKVTSKLLKAGTRRILLEKPGGLNIDELNELNELVQSKKFGVSEVLLGYNRRFHASTLQAEKMVSEDGGITSLHFEFTEWSHRISKNLHKVPEVMEHWVLSNSSHVLDLAFFLGGFPQEWRGWTQGSVSWHPSSSRFSGAGLTDRGALFSYFADWEAPGRWGVEVLTRKRRLILRPMEQLLVTPLGSVSVEMVKLDDQLDRDFKPDFIYKLKPSLKMSQKDSVR